MRKMLQHGIVAGGLVLMWGGSQATAASTCSDCEEQTAIVYRDGKGITPIAELWRGWGGQWERQHELARVPLLVDGTVWELTSRPVGVPWLDCACVSEAARRDDYDADERCTKTRTVDWPVAVGPLPGQEVSLASKPGDCGGEGGSYAPQLTYLGIFDGLVTLSARGSSNGCGAHAVEWVTFEATGLPAGGQTPLWDEHEGARIAEAGQQAAVAKFIEQYDERSAEDMNALRLVPMDLRAMSARWNDGYLQPSWLLSREACFACSNGLWNSYTEAVWVTPEAPLPSPLMPHAALAPALRSLAALVPDAIGFAMLPAVSLPPELFAPAARAAKRPTAPR